MYGREKNSEMSHNKKFLAFCKWYVSVLDRMLELNHLKANGEIPYEQHHDDGNGCVYSFPPHFAPTSQEERERTGWNGKLVYVVETSSEEFILQYKPHTHEFILVVHTNETTRRRREFMIQKTQEYQDMLQNE